MNILIEPMVQTDIAHVSEILIDAFNTSTLKENWTKEKSIGHINKFYNPQYSFVAKVHNHNHIVGAIICGTTIYENGPYLSISILVVNQKNQEHGIGTKLLNTSLDHAKNQGITMVELLAHPKLPSYDWYEKLGFKQSGWVDMEKSLV